MCDSKTSSQRLSQKTLGEGGRLEIAPQSKRADIKEKCEPFVSATCIRKGRSKRVQPARVRGLVSKRRSNESNKNGRRKKERTLDVLRYGQCAKEERVNDGESRHNAVFLPRERQGRNTRKGRAKDSICRTVQTDTKFSPKRKSALLLIVLKSRLIEQQQHSSEGERIG